MPVRPRPCPGRRAILARSRRPMSPPAGPTIRACVSMEESPVAHARPTVVLASIRWSLEHDVTEAELARLRAIADFRHAEFDRPSSWDEPPPPDPDEDARLIAELGDAQAL